MDEFWKHKSLEEMTHREWESLCDGCARCCLVKIIDEHAEPVRYTAVHCALLDSNTCRCSHYEQRTEQVAECVELTPAVVRQSKWLPKTCAYRLLAEGKELPLWHPLISQNPDSVIAAGTSIRGRTLSIADVHPNCLEEMVICWVRT